MGVKVRKKKETTTARLKEFIKRSLDYAGLRHRRAMPHSRCKAPAVKFCLNIVIKFR